jgi:ParB family chromosome partitioning protein
VEKTAAENSGKENSSAGKETPAAPDKRRALGRGLASLLPGVSRMVSGNAAPADHAAAPVAAASAAGVGSVAAERIAVLTGATAPFSTTLAEIHAMAKPPDGTTVLQLALDRIDHNPYQTRSKFPEEELEELAESIKTHGVIQPIVVRPGTEARYVLITGERRMRASKLAGKEKIPAIVRHVSDQQAAEMTVIENLQRQDLNCMDQASAFAKLSQDFKMTQEQIGDRVGLSRESVSNYMRLLRLPPNVKQYLSFGQLGFSEARVLLQFQDAELIAKLADEAVRKHMSVEQIEDLCIHSYVPKEKHAQGGARWVDPNVRSVQRELEAILGMRVRIRDRKGKGKIVLEYATLEDFDRVIEMLKGKKK